MRQCPSCKFHVELDWAACRRCGTSLPTVLEVERLTVPASLPRRAAPPGSTARLAPTAPVPLPPSDALLPRTGPAARKPADTWLPKLPDGRTVARHAGIAAAIVSAGLGVRRLLRHRS